MRKTAESQFQIRLDPDTYSMLREIRDKCEWPVSINVLANYAIKFGMANTRKDFNPKRKTKQMP